MISETKSLSTQHPAGVDVQRVDQTVDQMIALSVQNPIPTAVGSSNYNKDYYLLPHSN